jgi:hypothetical protein
MTALCQKKIIPVEMIYKQKVDHYLIKQDSLIKSYELPLIEVNKFHVVFEKALYSYETKEIEITGKVCYSNDPNNCMGLPKVKIFLSRKNEKNILLNEIKLGETSHDTDALDNNGFFEIKFNLCEDYSLFFYLPNFYLQEFKINMLQVKI